MSDNEERRVKAKHDVTQFYQRSTKRTVSLQNLPRGSMSIEGGSDYSHNTTNSDDEEETYIPSPRGRGKGIASASGSGSRTAEIQEEEEEGEEEVFDVEEITPTSYMHMGTPIFGQPLNPEWRAKINY
jgi:hypothetical protein